MRIASVENFKNSDRKNAENRTTKTKASATKPCVFSISLTRNKNNTNPILFGSVKKQNIQKTVPNSNKQNIFAQPKLNSKKQHREINLFEQLNTKISIDYINSIYSDLGVQFGYKLRELLENKENQEKQGNIKVSLQSQQQKQCLHKIKCLVNLKDKVNQSYRKMQNTRNLFSHISNKQSDQNWETNSQKSTRKPNNFHHSIESFLKYFQQKGQQLFEFGQKINEISPQNESVQVEIMQDEAEVDEQIRFLKQEIANQKRLSQKYEKQQKFLMGKLYFTQRKNHDLVNSSSNLKIKNTNLRETVRLSQSIGAPTRCQSPKLKRSLSMKLQKVRRFNLDQQPITINQKETKSIKMMKSKSTSSLSTGRVGLFLPNRQKQTFLDRIF